MKKRTNLNLLVIEGDRDYEKTHNAIPVNWQAFHVIELFMYFLPKVDLDGNSKLAIFFKNKADSVQQYMYYDVQGVSCYYVDEVEIERQRKLNKEDESEYYLNIIVDTLKRIAQINGRDTEIFNIIDETAQKVRDNNFEVTFHIKKLSKSSADRKFRANTYRHISSRGESWYVDIEDKNKNITRQNIDLSKKPAFISQTGVFQQSRWEGNRFIVSDRFGRVTATIDMLPLVNDGKLSTKDAHRVVDLKLASGQSFRNVPYKEIEAYIKLVEKGKEDFAILIYQDGYLQFYGVNDQFVAEMRVDLPGGDFRTYSFITKEKEQQTKRIQLVTPYGQFTPMEREVLSLKLLKTIVKKYYENVNTDVFLKSVDCIDTTEETIRYMGL